MADTTEGLSKAQLEIREAVSVVANTATEADKALVANITKGDGIAIVNVTPPAAAIVFLEHNTGRNRELNVTKVMNYKQDMIAGDWKLTHQGIAFYADGSQADGQHRMASTALSGMTLPFAVMSNFADDAFDAIDTGKTRTAADAAQLRGVADSKVKAAIAKATLSYEHKVEHGVSPYLSVIALERHLVDNDDAICEALTIADRITSNVGSPVMGKKEAATMVYLMTRGGYDTQRVVEIMSAIQIGASDTPDSPTLRCNEILDKANRSQSRKGVLNAEQRMALVFKTASMVSDNKLGKPTFKSGKEPLPAPTPPVTNVAAE